jgi:1-phosphofructokinase family hexose kinase
MILCVTPNPAIDRTLYVNSLHLGEVHRAEKVLAAAGGKGLNVARTIHTLGGEPFCMGLIGGHTGDLFSDLAKQEGLSSQWTQTQNETRTCVILVEEGRDATVVNERGVEVNVETAQLFCNDVWRMSARTDLVCVSGSLPPGFSTDIFQSLLSELVERKKTVWVDTSGQALKAALDMQGVNIKINEKELAEVLSVEISNVEQVVAAGVQLLERGIANLVVTLGKDGAVLCSANGVWLAQPPLIEPISSVGSGDAFLGGLMVALDSKKLLETALCHGVAAGAANALHFGGGHLSREVFDEMLENVKIIFLG